MLYHMPILVVFLPHDGFNMFKPPISLSPKHAPNNDETWSNMAAAGAGLVTRDLHLEPAAVVSMDWFI